MRLDTYAIKDLGLPQVVKLVQRTTEVASSALMNAAKTVFGAVMIGVIVLGFIGFAMSFFTGLAMYQTVLATMAVVVAFTFIVFGLAWTIRQAIASLRR
jgi:uncharacterized membrane protein YqjE